MSLRRLVLLVITLAGMALTGALGRWQLSRADEKQAMLAAAQAAERLPDADVGALLAASSPAQAAALMHRSIALRGHWLAGRSIYLENRVMDQKAGFYVLTPLQLEARSDVVLVVRGWAPRNFDDRSVLPPVQTPASEVELRGRLVDHVPSFFALGAESPGPIRQNVDLQAYARESGLPLAALMVELFPIRIRYTSMSLPYHIGNGWFGGFLPTVSFALVVYTGDIFYGLWYPVLITGVSLVVGMICLRETKNIDLDKN